MNIRLIIKVLMGLVVFLYICYLFGNYLKENSAAEKYLPPEIYRLHIDAYNDIQHNISTGPSHISNTHYDIRKSSTSSTNDWIKKMEEKYRQTNERIRKICKEYGVKSTFYKIYKQNIVNNMVVDVKHRLSYCPNAKVTSSSGCND